MIGFARRILHSILLPQKTRLTQEVLCTVMAEVTAIINARPLLSVCADVAFHSLTINAPHTESSSTSSWRLLRHLCIFIQNSGDRYKLLQTSFGPVRAKNTYPLCNRDRNGQCHAENFQLEIKFSSGTNKPSVTAGPWLLSQQPFLAAMDM